jgi:hypothetical protein
LCALSAGPSTSRYVGASGLYSRVCKSSELSSAFQDFQAARDLSVIQFAVFARVDRQLRCRRTAKFLVHVEYRRRSSGVPDHCLFVLACNVQYAYRCLRPWAPQSMPRRMEFLRLDQSSSPFRILKSVIPATPRTKAGLDLQSHWWPFSPLSPPTRGCR